MISANMRAFLDTIAMSELGPQLLAVSDRGYNVCVGSTPKRPILFSSYATHPMLRCAALNSDAAGRYQFMGRYWLHYKAQLGLVDFGPASQDRWAMQLIRECKATDAVESGQIDRAVALCKSRWASFPGAGYNQPEHRLAQLSEWFDQAGGVIA
jgi:muramidase (phage lysozyme)